MKAFKNWFFTWIFPWVPKRLLSHITGIFMRAPLIWPLNVLFIPLFAKIFHIRSDWAEKSYAEYRSFDAFFTRKLRPGLRPIQGEFIHPVDGVLSAKGSVLNGELIQAKGWTYALSEFLGDEELAKVYEGGTFATYYLCPTDYHRVHAVRAGHLVSGRHIPGVLWPVNEWSVQNIRRLFNLNERVILNFQGAKGRFSMVLVGATNVGYITITQDPSIVTNRFMWHAPTDRAYVPAVPIKAGDEVGVFHLGSTVICLYEKTLPGVVEATGPPVLMGAPAALTAL